MLHDSQQNEGFGNDNRIQVSNIKETLVSVIIPSRNSERTIAKCIESIRAQSYKSVELIVVDGLSTDSTKKIAEKMGALVVSLDAERSQAKNAGAKFANGKYLFFVDADHVLNPASIADCMEAMGGADGVLVTDQDIVGNSTVSRLVASRRKVLSNDPLNVAVRFVNKKVFNGLGGFDENLYAGEDLDFHRRFLKNGYKFTYSRAKEWHLGSPLDLRGLLNRSLYYSPNYLQYVSKNPLTSLRRLNPLRAVAGWKRSDTRSSDLLAVVFLGFLSNLFLAVGILFHPGLGRRSLSRVDRHDEFQRESGLTPSKKLVIANYDREGKDYDSIRYGRTKGGAFFSEVELENTVHLMKKGNVLHVGTATGRVSSYMTRDGFDYVGLEISKVMARITKKKLNGTADVLRADAENLPFRADAFDNIVSVRSFHFLPNPVSFLGDAKRVLKPNGRVIVSYEKKVHGREAFRRVLNLPPSRTKRTYYTNQQVAHMIQRVGMKTLLVGNVTKLPLLAYWRTENDKALRRIHNNLPYWFGTVGLVVGTYE